MNTPECIIIHLRKIKLIATLQYFIGNDGSISEVWRLLADVVEVHQHLIFKQPVRRKIE